MKILNRYIWFEIGAFDGVILKDKENRSLTAWIGKGSLNTKPKTSVYIFLFFRVFIIKGVK